MFYLSFYKPVVDTYSVKKSKHTAARSHQITKEGSKRGSKDQRI